MIRHPVITIVIVFFYLLVGYLWSSLVAHLLADLDYAQSKPAESLALLDKLSKSADSDEHKLAPKIKLAEQQIGQKNYDAAELVVADILAKDQRNVSGLKLRATIRIAKGEVEPAIADLREAINEQPDSADLLPALGNRL